VRENSASLDGKENIRSRPHQQARYLSLYDGQDRVGVVIARPGTLDAFDVYGVHLGRFKTVKAATSAINTSLSGACVGDTNARSDNSE
jgi:hypothetical protein